MLISIIKNENVTVFPGLLTKFSPMLVSVVVRFLTDSIYSFSSSRNDTTLIRWSIRYDDRVEAGSSNVNV